MRRKILNTHGRHTNQSVVFDKEITIPAGKDVTIDLKEEDEGRYSIGTPFRNIELQNLGNEAGTNVQPLVIYFNQARGQSQKIKKNFVFDKEDREIRSLTIKNVSATEDATFDLRLDNKDTQLSILKQIRNHQLNVVEDNSGTARIN